MVVNSKKLVEGLTRMYVGVAASPYGIGSASDMPDPDAPFGAAHANWRDVGYISEDGVTQSYGRETNAQNSSSQRSEVTRFVGNTSVSLSGSMMEATLLNLKDALGFGDLTITPAGVGTYGVEELRLSDSEDVEYIAILLEGVGEVQADGTRRPRRVMLPVALATGTVDYTQNKGNASLIPFEFSRVGGTEGEPIIHNILPPTS